MKKLFSILAGTFASLTLMAADKPAVKVGDPAPKFEGKDHEGKTWKLEDFAGKKAVLLYFYPKDNTPGCTAQACGLRDRLGDLKKDNVEVIGVSFDSAESHKKFVADHNLNFPLLVDTDGRIADLYGARKAPGAKMARRVSVLIDKDGKVAHVTDTPSAQTHLSEMKEAAGQLARK